MAASAFGQTPGTITTVAGNGNFGNSGDAGPAPKARLAFGPVFQAGNLHIANAGDSRVRKVDNSRTISELAGNSTSLCIVSFPATADLQPAPQALMYVAEDAQTDGKPTHVVKVQSYRFEGLMEDWRQT